MSTKFSEEEVNQELESLKKARVDSGDDDDPIFKSNIPKTDLNKVLKSD